MSIQVSNIRPPAAEPGAFSFVPQFPDRFRFPPRPPEPESHFSSVSRVQSRIRPRATSAGGPIRANVEGETRQNAAASTRLNAPVSVITSFEIAIDAISISRVRGGFPSKSLAPVDGMLNRISGALTDSRARAHHSLENKEFGFKTCASGSLDHYPEVSPKISVFSDF